MVFDEASNDAVYHIINNPRGDKWSTGLYMLCSQRSSVLRSHSLTHVQNLRPHAQNYSIWEKLTIVQMAKADGPLDESGIVDAI